MNFGVRILVNVVFATFLFLSIFLFMRGESKGAQGALLLAALVSPLLLEVWLPGRYALRKPEDGSPDTLINRMKQFKIDHPGIDGTLLLFMFAILAIAMLVGSLVGILSAIQH